MLGALQNSALVDFPSGTLNGGGLLMDLLRGCLPLSPPVQHCINGCSNTLRGTNNNCKMCMSGVGGWVDGAGEETVLTTSGSVAMLSGDSLPPRQHAPVLSWPLSGCCSAAGTPIEAGVRTLTACEEDMEKETGLGTESAWVDDQRWDPTRHRPTLRVLSLLLRLLNLSGAFETVNAGISFWSSCRTRG